jgi:enterochelin esterase-like enzyme
VFNSKKIYFIHPFFFNKVVSESGSVDQEKPAMAKKKRKKKKKKKKRKKKRDVEKI